ncbi:hypothetical protein BN1723_020862 [Verticillium longisporum]|nr:hypothetical protein BN1723_020862 [Verticillium longisporum]CRK38387.1 hypothetical protein BN1708_020510 [Verticillium longisporum]
MPSAPTC